MRLSYISGVALLLLTLLIGVLQGRGAFLWLDPPLMHWAGAARESGAGSALTPVMISLSQVGDTAGRMVLLALAVLLLGWQGRWRAAGWPVGVTITITLLNTGIKHLFRATRPDLLHHLDAVTSYSFPSGHASGNLVFFCALALLVGRPLGWAVAVPLALAIGFSRLWLGVHWPSDIAAGWIEGAGLLCLAWPLLHRISRRENISEGE